MTDAPPGGELEVREPEPLTPDRVLPSGIQPSPNYLAAIELGHVLAASGLYLDVREPAKAAVKVMIGLDLGVSPTAAMQGIHTFEQEGKTVFLIEGKLLGAVVKRHPDVEYKIIERTDERCEIEFQRRNEEGQMVAEGPNVVWTIEQAKKAVPKFGSKDTWKNYPAVMLTWRALAEGVRIYFPDIIAGQPIYAMEEFNKEADDFKVRDALKSPKAEPLTDEKAEKLRAEARGVYDSLRELNTERLLSGRFAQMVKNAEHSHEQLQNVVTVLTDMRDTEVKIVAAKVKLNELLGEPEAKPLIEAAERRPSQAERLEALEKAIAEREKPAEGEEQG
jgi:hypothetical protein